MKAIKHALLGAVIFVAATAASAQNEQFVPVLSYRVGPYAAGGSGYYGGAIDYWTLINMSGGINGVKLVWEECETEYNASKGVECYERLKKKNGGASTVEPLSTGIAYGLFDRVAQDKIPMTTFGYGLASAADGRVYPWVFPIGTTYWDQMAAMIAYLGQKEGGVDKLKGKKVAFLYHDSAYGKEPIPVLDALAAKHGFEALKIPVPVPGTTQESQWLQIRQARPDYVIVWTYGVMSTVALKTAAKTGYPKNKLLGANGAGKSTTLKAISNLLAAERGDVTKGTIEFKGKRVDKLTTNDLVRMGVCQVMEGRHCFAHLTVEENLLTGAFTRKGSRADIASALEKVYHYFPRLKQRRASQSGYTSGGEQQMTAVGRALMAQPSMILLDEPSMGLAPQIVEEIFEIVQDLNAKERVSFLLAEQNTNVALRFANYGYILENGRVVMDGDAKYLASNDDVKEFYLGLSSAGRKSFRDVKHYRRRKRWLS